MCIRDSFSFALQIEKAPKGASADFPLSLIHIWEEETSDLIYKFKARYLLIIQHIFVPFPVPGRESQSAAADSGWTLLFCFLRILRPAPSLPAPVPQYAAHWRCV